MTVETQQSIVRYTGNGVTTEFPVPFPVLEPGHLRLFTWDGRRQAEITEGWTVLGAGTAATVVAMNGPPAQGLTLTILRRMPLVQMMDLLNGGPFNAETLEASADNIVMMIQQIAEALGRAVVAPESFDGNIQYADFLVLLDNAEAAADRAQTEADRAETARSEAQAAKTQARASATRAKNSATKAEKAVASLDMPNIGNATPGQVLTAVEQPEQSLKLEYADPVGGLPSGGEAGQVLQKVSDDDFDVEWKEAKASGLYLGKIELFPFRLEDLAEWASGWYHANGDRFLLSSPQGQALNSLPANYKTDWAITTSGSGASQNINVPNLYHTDGRGLFIRAGASLGSVVGDAIRNITGSLRYFYMQDAGRSAIEGSAGAFYDNGTDTVSTFSSQFGRYTHAGQTTRPRLSFSADRVVPTANENRPLYTSMLPVIFLGV
jgi:hypothetical protein